MANFWKPFPAFFFTSFEVLVTLVGGGSRGPFPPSFLLGFNSPRVDGQGRDEEGCLGREREMEMEREEQSSFSGSNNGIKLYLCSFFLTLVKVLIKFWKKKNCRCIQVVSIRKAMGFFFTLLFGQMQLGLGGLVFFLFARNFLKVTARKKFRQTVKGNEETMDSTDRETDSFLWTISEHFFFGWGPKKGEDFS